MRLGKGGSLHIMEGCTLTLPNNTMLNSGIIGPHDVLLPRFLISDCHFDGCEDFNFDDLKIHIQEGHQLEEVVMIGLYLGPGSKFAGDAGFTLASMNGTVCLKKCDECQQVMPAGSDDLPIHSKKDADYCKAYRVMCT